MPTLPLGDNAVIAVLCGDLHLSHKPPSGRIETDWYGTMTGYIGQLKVVAKRHNCPILCSGDIFDKWNSPPELINFALRELPVMYAIPGNHDLPAHRYEDRYRSAYWTLVEAGVVKNIPPGDEPTCTDHLAIWGFPYGFDVAPCKRSEPLDGLNVALVHAYIWTRETGYIGASEDSRLAAWKAKLSGYHVALFGDNHNCIHSEKGPCTIFNPGGFIRRRTDEQSRDPCIGFLHRSGKVTIEYLDTENDVFSAAYPDISTSDQEMDLSEFLESLNELESTTLDFVETLRRAIDDQQLGERAKRIVLGLLDKRKT